MSTNRVFERWSVDLCISIDNTTCLLHHHHIYLSAILPAMLPQTTGRRPNVSSNATTILQFFRSKSKVHLAFIASVPSWKFPELTKSITGALLGNIPGWHRLSCHCHWFGPNDPQVITIVMGSINNPQMVAVYARVSQRSHEARPVAGADFTATWRRTDFSGQICHQKMVIEPLKVI